ncbi:hypothetical protein [Bacillus sp. FJAT-45350]|uniref:hypothetical protein n=1 Tax=Bacillus sp. FJAT-45350 TaxID=2011014 RepID=UPI000BB912D0|nr:hypothetical protein [Bacillus sp. FJAT-45350]
MAKNVRIHPLILLALFINSILMGLFSYNQFVEGSLGYGNLFLFFAVMFLTMVISGIMKNRKKE